MRLLVVASTLALGSGYSARLITLIRLHVEDDADTEVFYLFKNLRHNSESPGWFKFNFTTKDELRKRLSETVCLLGY